MSTTAPADSLRPSYLLGIGSITKTFTTAVVLRLAERGLLGLDDSIIQHLPSLSAYPNIDPRITIRQLLGHTSGLAEYTQDSAFASQSRRNPRQVFTSTALLNYVGARHFAPGSAYEYNNTDFVVLGLLLETRLGRPLSLILQDELLAPNNLHDTFLPYGDTLFLTTHTLAHGWSLTGGNVVDLSLQPRTAMFSSFNAAGGLVSTAADIARWGRALFNGPVLTAASLQQMQTVSSLSGTSYYGLGCRNYTLSTQTAWGHAGAIPGYHSIFSYVPACDVSIAILVNDDRFPLLRLNLLKSLYAIVKRNVCTTLSLNEDHITSAPALYPNPAIGRTRVGYSCAATVRQAALVIHDEMGRRVRSLPLNCRATEVSLDLTGLPAGVYVCRIVTDGQLSPATRLMTHP